MLVRKMTVLVVACWLCAGLPMFATQQPSASKTAKAPLPEVTPEQFRKGVEEKFAKSKGRATVKKKNPNAGPNGIKRSLVFTLQQQKLGASAAHMRAPGVQSIQSAGAQAGSSQGMLSPQHTLLNTPQNNTASIPQTAPAPSNQTLMRSPPPSVGPSHTMNSTVTRAGQAPPPTVNPKTKQTDSKAFAPRPLAMCLGPGVRSVNQKAAGVVFTPIQDYNAYTIIGCLFGNQPGHAYLIGKFRAQQVNLQIQYWTDNEIDARVDPTVTGELDQDNVSLVIVPAHAPQIKATGFKFMAARSDPDVFLSNIPASWVKLQAENVKINNFVSKPVPPDYASPANGWPAPQDANGDSAFVSRYYAGYQFPQGADTYDFSHLASGWATDAMQMYTYDQDNCPYIVTYRQTLGFALSEWTGMDGNNIKVFWTTTSCSGFMPSPLGIPLATYSNHTGSYYALNVWVRGPRCTDPYTGNAQQKCMQNVIKCGAETCGP